VYIEQLLQFRIIEKNSAWMEAETSGIFLNEIVPSGQSFLNLEAWKWNQFFVTGRGQV
jgi:hypothetical protein